MISKAGREGTAGAAVAAAAVAVIPAAAASNELATSMPWFDTMVADSATDSGFWPANAAFKTACNSEGSFGLARQGKELLKRPRLKGAPNAAFPRHGRHRSSPRWREVTLRWSTGAPTMLQGHEMSIKCCSIKLVKHIVNVYGQSYYTKDIFFKLCPISHLS